jgi:hypothetical protein
MQNFWFWRLPLCSSSSQYSLLEGVELMGQQRDDEAGHCERVIDGVL